MGKLILISGCNDSGKSLFAEQLIAQTRGERYYIATMIPCTQENHRRIEKHRVQREGLGFQTLELPHQVGNAPVTTDSVVLLEDVSNLFANAVFEKGNDVDGVCRDIFTLVERCRVLVAVTITGLSAEGCDTETVSYIHGLEQLNHMLFASASVAVTMWDGQPVYEKGDVNDLT